MTRSIFFTFAAFIFSLNTFSSDLSNCEYGKTQVLKITAGSGPSCSQSKLCYAEILCTKKLTSGKEIDINKNIICALDSKGSCPAVEACRKDKSTATFENEAQIGTAGSKDWAAIASNVELALQLMHMNKKSGLPIDQGAKNFMKDIEKSSDSLKEKSVESVR